MVKSVFQQIYKLKVESFSPFPTPYIYGSSFLMDRVGDYLLDCHLYLQVPKGCTRLRPTSILTVSSLMTSLTLS
jgi:hypothetical protein